MKKKYIIVLSVFLLTVGIWVSARGENIRQWLETFTNVLRIVPISYVQEVDSKELMEAAIRGMLSKLDPHSTYLTKKQYENLEIKTKGKYGGLGFIVGKTRNIITVISPFEGTPAYRAGIQPGDKIVKIDDLSTKGIDINDAVDKMRGTPGTKVTLTIQREGIEEPIDFHLTRAEIKIKNIQYYGIIKPDIGYIRLSGFSKNAGKDVSNALDSLMIQGAKKFIIDLRMNPGGLLDEAIKVADNFLPQGKAIVSTKGRIRDTNRNFYATTDSKTGKSPLIILVNRSSASASEIVAGAVQDWDLGLIVGDTTFGKGSVQTLMRLKKYKKSDALKLTTALYYTPSGRCINHSDTLFYLLKNPTSGKEFKTLGTLKRKLISGGSIIPDTVLKLETFPASFLVKIIREGAFMQYTAKYAREHSELTPEFEIDTKILKDFKSFLIAQKIEFKDAEFDSVSHKISETLKMMIAEAKWGSKGKYKVILSQDPWIKESVELISKARTTQKLFKIVGIK